MELPDDIIELILGYGDVVVTQRYTSVMLELEYYHCEFNYQTADIGSATWYRKPACYFPLFVFNKSSRCEPSVQYLIHLMGSQRIYNTWGF